MNRRDVHSLERGDLVLDVVTGELLEFLWLSGYDRVADGPFAVQLRPMVDKADYSRAITYAQSLTWRYVNLVNPR